MRANEIEAMTPRATRYCVRDDEVEGLELRVSPVGVKTFSIRVSVRRRWRRLTIGRYPKITLAQARAEARRIVGEAELQQDPTLSRKRRGQAVPTVAAAVDRHVAEMKERIRPSTVALYERYRTLHIGPSLLGKLEIDQVEPADIADFMRELHEHPTLANRCLELLAAVMRKAEQRSWGYRKKGTNPVDADEGVVAYDLGKRERYPSEPELRAIGKALEKLAGEHRGGVQEGAARYIRLKALTGARRSEIQHLRWSDVDLDAGRFYIDESKTRRRKRSGSGAAETRPLGNDAIAYLRTLDRSSAWVCTNKRGDRPIADTPLDRAWERVLKEAKVKDLTPHDLRHGLASAGANAGVALYLVGAALGHSSPRTTQRYAHLEHDAVRRGINAAMDRIAPHILPADLRKTRRSRS